MRSGRKMFARQRLWIWLLPLAFLAAICAFVLGTPLLFTAVEHLGNGNWPQFSNEAQTYGGVASVIGVLALVGVAASFGLQRRDTTANLEVSQRTFHAELLSKTLDDPRLIACWGPSIHGDVKYDQQHIYSNMIVSFWRAMFEIGKVTESQLHALSAGMFSAEPGRRYWSVAGQFRGTHYLSKLDRRFNAILSEEYNKALATRSNLALRHIARSRKSQDEKQENTLILAVGVVAGGIAGAILMTFLRPKARLLQP